MYWAMGTHFKLLNKEVPGFKERNKEHQVPVSTGWMGIEWLRGGMTGRLLGPEVSEDQSGHGR